MMGTVNCDQTTADLWKYNIDLDADAFPLICLRPLVVCGVDGDNEFFHLYVLRLDGNEAARRAALIAILAGGWQSDLNLEEFILNSNGDVQQNGANIPARPFVLCTAVALSLSGLEVCTVFRLLSLPLLHVGMSLICLPRGRREATHKEQEIRHKTEERRKRKSEKERKREKKRKRGKSCFPALIIHVYSEWRLRLSPPQASL